MRSLAHRSGAISTTASPWWNSAPRNLAALTALALAVSAAACVTHPQNVDPTSPELRDEIATPVLELRWKKTIVDRSEDHRAQEFASPAVWYDRLFVGSRGGWLYALRARDGEQLWKAKIGALSSRPLVDRGRIFVGTDDGYMLCLDTLDGSEKWRYQTRGAILRTPVLAGDLLVFANEADQVFGLDSDKGTYRWQYKSEQPEEFTLRGHAGVTIAGEYAITGFANGSVVALRVASGSVAWLTSLRGKESRFVDVDSRPAVVGDTVFASSAAGGIYALDLATGHVRWQVKVAGAGTVVSDETRLYFAAAEVGMFAADQRGNVMWRQGLRGGGEPADPIVTGDYLIYTLSEDGVFIADKRSGELFQYFDPGFGVSATPALDGDMLYVMSNNGVLYAMHMDRL